MSYHIAITLISCLVETFDSDVFHQYELRFLFVMF